MSILDDAIREHLELKRAHGADDAELKKLEDEAFGPPARPDEPDPLAEAPTEFMAAPEGGEAEAREAPSGRRAPNIADLQEAPEPPQFEAPAEEEQPAMEHEVVPAAEAPEAGIDGGHSTEERHAIAEQPTELFDVEGQYQDAATEAEGPSDDDLVDAELAEPRLAPVDSLAGIDGGGTAEPDSPEEPVAAGAPEAEAPAPPGAAEEDEPEDEFDEFFSEQRLSDELNQALEAPLPDEPAFPATEEAAAVVEVEEAEVDDDVEFEEDEEEYDAEDEGEPADEDEGERTHEDEGERTDEHEVADRAPAPEDEGDDDVLEKTPDFLEDAPEDDNLWFEQKPPKDFDFDD